MIFKDLEVLVLYSQSNILYIAKQKKKKKCRGQTENEDNMFLIFTHDLQAQNISNELIVSDFEMS